MTVPASAGHPDLARFVAAGAAAGRWPGGVYAVGAPGAAPRFLGAEGALALEPERETARADALYDLASLSKPLALGIVLLRLADRGAVDLDRPLDDLLPELRGYAGRTPSFADLLTHSSGLPAWAPLYRLAARPEDVMAAIAALPPAAAAGTAAIYSCVGAIAATIALRRGTNSGLRALFEREVGGPLGLGKDEMLFSPLPQVLTSRAAPTERGRAREAEMAGGDSSRADVPGPDEPLRGVVHDGNCRWLGGDAGNAGLFGTARAVFRVAAALLEPGALLSAKALARAATPAAGLAGDARTFGFRSGADAGPAGKPLGRDAFGHSGFTGTSVWIAPRRGLVAALLTNRVHPRWREAPTEIWRGEFNAIAARVAEEAGR